MRVFLLHSPHDTPTPATPATSATSATSTTSATSATPATSAALTTSVTAGGSAPPGHDGPGQTPRQEAPKPQNLRTDDLMSDLELEPLLQHMAQGDPLIRKTMENQLLQNTLTLETIHYRQQVMRDTLENPQVVRALYEQIGAVMEEEGRLYQGIFSTQPASVLQNALMPMEAFTNLLEELCRTARTEQDHFRSEGFRHLFGMLQEELPREYLEEIRSMLKILRLDQGTLLGATLGPGNRCTRFSLLRPRRERRWKGWLRKKIPSPYTFSLAEGDEIGYRIIEEIKNRGLNKASHILLQSADHLVGFLGRLREELSFYVGALNLRDALEAGGNPLCMPLCEPCSIPPGSDPPKPREHRFSGLYDPALAVQLAEPLAGNDAILDGSTLVIVTGANKGGKSTFLRSIGTAQLMMQSGMFVPAQTFRGSLCRGLFTHYRRGEAHTMNSGKLDEELRRMSEIADALVPGSLVLLNETFAATNEGEGSEIARGVVQALVDRNITLFFVTHLYGLAKSLHDQNRPDWVFLRAHRDDQGGRTYQVTPGEPLSTSFGKDLWHNRYREPSPPQPANQPANQPAPRP
ncbi:MutS domain V [Alkalispirochaeta americana]|uniref:MutS domain V n=1 Tax=Alkalispirochaeta americana TaxID=159291 RepID=A0A1N6N758_9SPIO|nr:DNA mismatch repair protein MutS [Alkalispirochaeta americana]SIP87899.1 MutS domain V [Alkalispirochaeta americana]